MIADPYQERDLFFDHDGPDEYNRSLGARRNASNPIQGLYWHIPQQSVF
jgi:hypothetical protein